MSKNNPRSDPRPRANRPRPQPPGKGAKSARNAPPPVSAPAKPIVAMPGLEAPGTGETMRLIRRSVRNRWDIPTEVFRAAPAIVARILADPATDIRDKIRATQTLAMLDRNNTDLMLDAYRIERLEDGQSTENVAFFAGITDEQMNAVANSIKPIAKKPKR